MFWQQIIAAALFLKKIKQNKHWVSWIEKIIGASKINGKLAFIVKYYEDDTSRIMTAKIATKCCPLLVNKFYLENIDSLSFKNTNSDISWISLIWFYTHLFRALNAFLYSFF